MASSRQSTMNNVPDSAKEAIFYDLWNDGLGKRKERRVTEHEDYYLRQTKKKQPRKFQPKEKKTNGLPAVDLPHSGSSYNPSLDDHVLLLAEANKAETAKLRLERRLERRVKVPSADKLVTPEIKQKELMEGLESDVGDGDEDDKADVICSATESFRPAVAPIKAENRKLSAVRKREKLKKRMEKAKLNEKRKRIRENDVYRLRSLKRDISRHERESLAKCERKLARKARLSKLQPPKLSAVPYEAPDADLQLSSEIRGSLLELKPAGSLLEDRYKSLQKRGIVEPRTKQNRRRKYKLKKYEKRSHRDLPDGYLPR